MVGGAVNQVVFKYYKIPVFFSIPGASLSSLLGAVRSVPVLSGGNNGSSGATCHETQGVWSACQCRLELCIGWYPCGLKYCRGGKEAPAQGSYRCGIRTCRKCRHFSYYVRQKQLCLWDE
ncbi:hypothetical protein AAG570_006528 [Ranatra chinensis]|uniref:Out at first C-terminal domain-containing protein n=1 Tax=Ranatra chinensis TaxID=642074 RepID=A0ABD0YU92_9HEMI